ncbi:hypothetical protein FACS189443_6280 [Planctomycetales bacterium]|nr:hypothetical protein FACS189443_6280 [Planctomycetales bacterium]
MKNVLFLFFALIPAALWATDDLLTEFKKGENAPMKDVKQIVFTTRTQTYEHWYANFGYYASNQQIGDIPPNDEGRRWIAGHEVEWIEVDHGTRVTIELEAKYNRGRGSVDEYLEQTAISNPHVTLHYKDPDGGEQIYERVVEILPPEPVEIKPHPYGVELGRLAHMIENTHTKTIAQFLAESFSKVSPKIAKEVCAAINVDPKTPPHKIDRDIVEKLYETIQTAKIPSPSTDCITPIGEEHLLKGLHKVVPGQFFATATRPPAVYRGNPFESVCVNLGVLGGVIWRQAEFSFVFLIDFP